MLPGERNRQARRDGLNSMAYSIIPMRQALFLSNEASGVMAHTVWIRMSRRGHRARGEPGQRMYGVEL